MTNAQDAGLVACPFDGGAAFQGSTLDEGHYVMCSNEHCLGMVGYTETAQEAADGWNRRAAPASPLPEGGGDILWMMHVRGPDDIYPAPDYETVVAWCDYVNDVLAKAVPEVMTKAVPAIWTGTPESHADGLPEAIKGWTLPAAPTGDRP